MEVLKGVASNVRNTVSISGGGKDSQITTTHISLFQIDGRQIKASSSEPVTINDGDEVLVVGRTGSGTFNALAYKNLTTSVEGNAGWALAMMLGVVFPIAGIYTIIKFSDPFFGVFPKIIGGIFIAVGVYMIYSGARVLQAINQLRQKVS